jgi:hypothetical protein
MKKLASGFLFFALTITCHYGMAQVEVTVIQNNTSCQIPNGSATVSVGGVTLGYTFEWYDINLNPLGVSGPVINTLPAGNFVVIVRDASAAVVGVTHFVIADHTVRPVVEIESIANTSCYAVANGALITSVSGNPGDYSYAWYEGADVQGSLISTDTHLTERSGGGYTLVVTNVVTGCHTTLTAQISSTPAIPVVNVVVISHNTSCTTPNGELNAVTEQAAGQYIITWYDVALNPLGITGPVADHLGAGNYIVVVTDAVTGCTSSANNVINAADCDSMSPGSSGVAGDVITNEKKITGTGIGYYPNPASGTLWVSSTGPAALVLINQSGEIVFRQNVYLTDTPFALDVSDLKPGKYILKAYEGVQVTNFQIIVKK